MQIQLKKSRINNAGLNSIALLSCLVISACTGLANKPSSSVDKDWPSYGRDYTNQRLSPLTQINQQNVKDLQLARHFKSGVSASFQATPIVTNGVMYVALP